MNLGVAIMSNSDVLCGYVTVEKPMLDLLMINLIVTKLVI